jgi:hypothetical protein
MVIMTNCSLKKSGTQEKTFISWLPQRIFPPKPVEPEMDKSFAYA